jgi:uncharacterized protein (TIGR03905 family)
MIIYKPEGVCAKEIRFDIVEGRIKNLMFVGGCPGNLHAICKLVEGMKIEDVIEKFEGNICRNQTSCTDQLAQALRQLMKQDSKLINI